jgi:hypothetical protein
MAELAHNMSKILQGSKSERPPNIFTKADMDEDGAMSVLDSPFESDDSSNVATDKSLAVLQSYLDSLPYECETVEDMHSKLEYIVGKIVICAKSRNWLVLTTWDGALQWYGHSQRISKHLKDCSCFLSLVGFY